MRFADADILKHLIWLVPVAAIFWLWAERRRRAACETFAARRALSKISPRSAMAARNLKMLADILAILLLVVALARPQWGFYWNKTRAVGIDIIFAIDTSRSMLARDLSPDRLSFAKMELKEFVKSLKGDRVGLVAFAGDAFLYCPLTSDHKGFDMILDTMDVEAIERGGTSIASAIVEAERAFKWAAASEKSLVLISDGENTAGDIDRAIEEAKKDAIQISCVGIGRPEGTVIEYMDGNGSVAVVKDKSGKPVRSRLDEDLLKRLASSTGGVYVRASESLFGLEKIYEERLSQMKKRQSDEGTAKTYRERYRLPLAAALALVLIGTFANISVRDE